MKVLLISENRCRENLVPWPIGAACIASAAESAGHDVRGLDLMFSRDPASEVASAVRDFQPDVVGVSLRNIDNQDMHSNEFFLPEAKKIVEVLAPETEAPVVPGGAGFTIFPLECLEYLNLGLGIVGEGEEAFVSLLDALEAGADPSGIGGLAILRAGTGRINPAERLVDFQKAPPPDRRAFDVAGYDWVPGKGPPFVANIQSRRGCPLRCIYCSSPLVEGRVVRCREARDVADELESLEKEHGLSTVIFADSHFNCPVEYAKELCALIIKKRLSIKWSCGLHPLYHDESLFPMLREAGCFAVSIGNESGSDVMLESLRKDFTKSDVRKNVVAAREQGFQVSCFLLLGGPGETRDSVEESIALMDELAPEAVRVTVGIRIFPGCELERIAAEEGVISPGQNLLEPAFYLEKAVAPWLYDRMKEVCASRPGWFL
jgi:radical SAM superfamily enzyme YgiQ (UPF0313 family)